MKLNRLLHSIRLLAALSWALSSPALFAASEAALVTAVAGQVGLSTPDASQPLQAFVKLQPGDRLTLAQDASVRLVYFDSRRQESWTGPGRLEVGAAASVSQDLPPPQVQLLPEFLVRQIARTPGPPSQGRAGAVRLRSLPEPAARVEAEYLALREQSDPADLNPELYRLAGLFELREFARVEQALAELREHRSDDEQVDLLVQLYRRAIRDARNAWSAPAR